VNDEASSRPTPEQTRPVATPEREALAHAVRALIAETVGGQATAHDLAAAASAVTALVGRLRAAAAANITASGERFGERSGSPAESGTTMADFMPYDVVIGRSNPIAVPVTIEFDPPTAIGRAVFGAQYAGAPGCVHGAVIAGVFDVVLTAANVLSDAAGPTRSLTVRYRRPTLLDVESVFEARVTSTDGSRTTSAGRLLQEGVVVAEAEGEFAVMDRSRIAAMHRRVSGGRPDAGAAR